IVYTENFFRELGLPVSLEDVDLTESAIDPIIKQLEVHNMVKLGEHGTNDLEVSRRILQRAVTSKAS
ncbi:NADH-dependent alcohol dehydrogenase, partial [Psychrobacter sp. SIMBA_152]